MNDEFDRSVIAGLTRNPLIINRGSRVKRGMTTPPEFIIHHYFTKRLFLSKPSWLNELHLRSFRTMLFLHC